MLILGIETSSDICSVSLYKNNDFLYYNESNTSLKHSVTLFNMINDLINKTKIKIKDLDYIAVSNGPGSFTGLRIGVAAALGLSYKDNIKIKYINTLESLNYCIDKKINKNYSDNKNYIVDLIYAQKNRLYINIYDIKRKKMMIKDSLIDLDEFIVLYNKYLKTINNFIIAGDGYVLNKSELDKKINYKNNELYTQNAKLIVLMSLDNKYKNMTASINYVQKSSAEINYLKNKFAK